MKDQRKSKQQLIAELEDLRRRVALLETVPAAAVPPAHQRLGGELIGGELTGREEAQQGQDRLQVILTAVVDCLPFEFFAVGTDGRYMLVNAVCREHYGDALGKLPEECAPDEATRRLWVENNRRAAAGQRVKGEVEVQRDGQTYHYYNIITPIQKGDRFYGILGTNIDITERKRAQNALQEANDGLEVRVHQRTAELAVINEQLQCEVEERRRAETALQDAHRKLITTLDSITAGFTSLDRQWRVTYLNPAAARLVEKRPEEMLGKVVWEIFPEASGLKLFTEFHRAVEENVAVDFEEFYPEPFGRCYEFHCYPSPEGLSVYFTDVTGQRQAEDARRQSEEKYRSLLEACPDSVVMSDFQGQVLFASRQTWGLIGLPESEELVGRSIFDFLIESDRKRLAENMANLLKTGVRRNTEYTAIGRDGSPVPTEMSSALIRDAHGEPKAVMAVIRDIADRKRTRDALEREYRTLRHLLQSSDRERQLIAYEIHDGLAQQLAGAIMQFQIADHLKETAPQDAAKAYDAGMTMLRQGHFEARRLISGVRPPILDEAGIVTAIAHLVNEQRRQQGPKIEFHSRVEFDRLVGVLENAVYRIVQEGLINACKHSRSAKVRVELLQEGDRLYAEIRDWGVGFDPQSVGDACYGLEGIRQRVRLLDGQIFLETAPGKGTRITVQLPVVLKDKDPDQ